MGKDAWQVLERIASARGLPHPIRIMKMMGEIFQGWKVWGIVPTKKRSPGKKLVRIDHLALALDQPDL